MRQQSGAAADTLAFHDEQLGFQIDYPQDWQSTSPGTDKVVFANQEDAERRISGRRCLRA